jgi:hypothetical protein
MQLPFDYNNSSNDGCFLYRRGKYAGLITSCYVMGPQHRTSEHERRVCKILTCRCRWSNGCYQLDFP